MEDTDDMLRMIETKIAAAKAEAEKQIATLKTEADKQTAALRAEIDKQVAERKQQYADLEKRTGKTEIRVEGLTKAVEEKFDRIFNAIEKMEGNIEKIANSLDTFILKSAEKTAAKFDKLSYEIMRYLLLAGVGFAAGRIFFI